ncbi:MAG TPA: DNA mismatch repair endonuclease MutL [Cyclobacteriaceae bacterium]|nr:DNA mismatch repair endonuclease MutL [Cyclobacteriaceae bacterium]
MPDIIQLLPDSIANQIAAGEVVQRPASAVKELLENSIDAGAKNIKLIVKDAGKGLLQVMDDGAGMSETDARMSLERHATSKIRKAEDLFTIRTMGFRGEALASIAAVSQLEMKTRLANKELGTLLVVEASEVKKQELVACEKGTSISVKNLFYNIPARRNFLKSNPVELKHIIDEFQRLALAHSEVAFTFFQGDEMIYDLPVTKAGSLSQRVVNLFGKSYQEQLASCQEETEYVKVSGFVGKPAFARKTRGEQFLFVNKRFIRSNYLNHAVMTAFEGLLPENSFPFYVIFIEIDPKHIDVNVHPTKTEIKFDDERAVYAVMRAAVRQSMGAHNLAPSIDFQEDVNVMTKLGNTSSDVNREIYFDERFQSSLNRSNQHPDRNRDWEKLFEGEATSKLFQPEIAQTSVKTEQEMPYTGDQTSVPEKTLTQLHDKYILRQVKNGMMIVDQQGAHERILFEKFMEDLKYKSAATQQSLFPKTISFPAADFALIMEVEQEIKALGFRFEVFGKNTVLVNGVPANLKFASEKQLFEGLIDQFKHNQSELSLPLQENLARALAKRAAVKAGQKLESEEMQELLTSLFSCKTPNYSPEGKPTFYIFELSRLESYFNRL